METGSRDCQEHQLVNFNMKLGLNVLRRHNLTTKFHCINSEHQLPTTATEVTERALGVCKPSS